MVAHRIDGGPLRIDGKLSESLWADAPAFSHFVESFPTEGAVPSFRTEARVLYDNQFLYVGVRCFDPDPTRIVRQLGRRDSTPAADLVDVAISSSGDGRTAYDFLVNAAGVQRDQLLFADVNASDAWDAVWDGAASVDADGWSVELKIPFRILRFSSLEGWTIEVRRTVPRTHQVFDSTLIPRNANPSVTGALVVSRFGPLVGLSGTHPRRGAELAPYVAAGLTGRPEFSDPARPHPTLLDPTAKVGFDFKTQVSNDLVITGTVNPDFGQVEADQVILNLSTAEPFFPEKRPFFLEGLDVFQPVGSEYNVPELLFYSRRIGLDSPVLGAAKLTGTVWKSWDVGVLEALTLGAANPSSVPLGYGGNVSSEQLAAREAQPDRHYQFRLRQPFWFGPNDALPGAHPVSTNAFALVARDRINARDSVGVTFTASTPLEQRCRRSEFPSDADFHAAGCNAWGANVLGLDTNLRDKSGEWGGVAQLEASQQVGSDPAGRVLRDGTVLRPNDLGYGGHLRAGKLGGEPFRFDVVYVYEAPRLDVNALGFQPLSNIQWADLNLHYIRSNGFGPFHNLQVDYNLDLNWSTDGRGIPRGVNTNIYGQLQLPSYDLVGLRVGWENQQYDPREVTRAGIPFERVRDGFLGLVFNTDPNRRLQAQSDIFGYLTVPRGPVLREHGWGWDVTAIWRPQDRLETQLAGSYGHKPDGARYLETDASNNALFGNQDPAFLSLTLRQQLVLTPRLTFQLYAQLFSSAVRYGAEYTASLNDRSILSIPDLHLLASQSSTFDQHLSQLVLNAVVRWEYRLGSLLYLVYTRSQSELPPTGPPSHSVLPAALFQGPVNQTILLKLSYWWDI